MKTNMIKSAIMFMALGAVVLTSCTKNEQQTQGNERVAVRFTSAIASPSATTKASGATWASGDKVGIFMAYGLSWTTVDGVANRLCTTTGTNSFAPASGHEIYFPVTAAPEEVDFYAYYPYTENITGIVQDSEFGFYPVALQDQRVQADIDFMYSNNVKDATKEDPNVTLVFRHMLSKIVIKTTAGLGLTADDLSNLAVQIIGMNTTAAFDITDGELGDYGNLVPITTFVADPGKQYEAIVLPAGFEAEGFAMKFALNNYTGNVFTRVNTEVEAFEAGKVYTYNITIQRTGVTFTCEITDWETAPGGDRGGIAE